MTANPILAEVMRGGRAESVHRGALCVAGSDGKVLAETGNIDRSVFPRSAVKSIQALAMFRSGAVDKFDLDDEMLALACASHRGEPAHIAGVKRFLAAIGLGTGDLECGAHPPTDPATRDALRAVGEAPSPIYNTCSGKHAGMLAVAKALGASTKGYVQPDHPVQQLVRQCLESVTGAALCEERCGTDGCSIPTWAIPLKALATGFARMATGEGLSAADAAAAGRLVDASTSHPYLVSGTGKIDTDLMAAFGGRLMLKGGAEGVYCGAVRDPDLGFALKIDDGNMQAAELVAASLIEAIAKPDARAKTALAERTLVKNRNWRGVEVGELRPTDAARPVL
ncbi:MAG: asparaginase [Cucumibacter sp.]